MTDSSILFSTFYNKIRTEITLYLQREPKKEEYSIFIHTISNNLFKEKFTRDIKYYDIIDTIHNNLIIYLEMITFIKNNQKPYMRETIDTTNVVTIFNRFYYLYSIYIMEDKCDFSSTISNIIHSYLEVSILNKISP